MREKRLRLMRDGRIAFVLDVGANEGQYAESLRADGYTDAILSFEPISDAYQRLQNRAIDDPLWQTRNVAVGGGSGRATLYVSANSYSSSLLPITDRCLDAAPEAAYERTEPVEVVTLDSLDVPDVPLMLKADVQGGEPEVLRGAAQLLSRVSLLELELSLVPLYEGGLLAHELCGLARGFGFFPVVVGNPWCHPKTGEILALDALFQRVAEHETA